ncbi:OsmC family peroxiredoxin [Candidatus Thorarchaeota archaeon]|nr:MAG: OsmC family peroxiredoxin [Candidatus Thorarchaeota archaeon]
MSNLETDEHKYDMVSRWVREKIVTIEIEGKPDFEVATPPDFWPDSPKETYSPEDLFVASAVSCYGASLSGVAIRFHAEFTSFTVKATGTLRKGEYGWEFEQITLSPRIVVPTQKDRKRMEKAAERAHRYCVVSNSMKCPVHLDYKIVVENI